MKRMKGAVVMDPSTYAVYEDSRTRFKHQSLLQDFEELQKETEVMKKKLQIMKQRKLTLSAEVRFLRKRYKYLIADQHPNLLPKQDIVQPQKFDIRRTSATKGKNNSKKEAALRPLIPAPVLNRKERIYKGAEATSRKPAPIFDLNQRARTFSGKETALQGSAPIYYDIDQKERIYSGKDATKRHITPVFDLNQILTDEELQSDSEPSRMEEPKKSLLRGGSDEQLNDMKLSICRNMGNGSNRAGKRKISWQDQVALRV